MFLVVVYVFAPEGMSREINSVSTREVLDRVSGKGVYHSRVSTAIFKDYPFFGVGYWGYRHLCAKYMTPEELKSIQLNGGANVHNDYLQFMCEFGGIGTLLIIATFVFLVLPVMKDWYQYYHISKFTRPGDSPVSTISVYSLPPPVFWTFVGVIFVLIHACGDCPLRSGAVMSAILTSLASTEGFLPDHGRPEIAKVSREPRNGSSDGHRHHHHHHGDAVEGVG